MNEVDEALQLADEGDGYGVCPSCGDAVWHRAQLRVLAAEVRRLRALVVQHEQRSFDVEVS